MELYVKYDGLKRPIYGMVIVKIHPLSSRI